MVANFAALEVISRVLSVDIGFAVAFVHNTIARMTSVRLDRQRLLPAVIFDVTSDLIENQFDEPFFQPKKVLTFRQINA